MEPKIKKEITTRYQVVKKQGRSVRKKAYVTERLFDAAGRIVEQTGYSWRRVRGWSQKPGIWKDVHHYQDDKIITEIYSYPFKKLDFRHIEYLDAEGKKEHCETFDHHSEEAVSLGKSFWKYDKKNRLIEEIILYPPAEDCDMRIRYTYDIHDRIAKSTMGGLNDDLPDETVYEYDEKGRKIKEDNLLPGELNSYSTYAYYEYDEKGRKIKYVNLLRNEIYDYILYAYDEGGNMIEMQEYSRDVPDREPRLQRVTRYRYEIGKNKKTTYTDCMHYDKAGKVTTYRTIEVVKSIIVKTGRGHGPGSR